MTFILKIRIFLVLSIVFYTSAASGSETKISGVASGAEGATIELLVYPELFTWTPLKLDSKQIKQNGQFEFSIKNFPEPRLAIIKINEQQGEIVIEPGNTYVLKISNILKIQKSETEKTGYLLPSLDIEINNPWKNELNGLLKQFNTITDDFMSSNFVLIARQGNKQKVKEYATLLSRHFPGIDNTWFNNTQYYSIANLEFISRSASRETLVAKHLNPKPLLYHHPEYVDFFKALFDKYLIAGKGPVKRQEIITILKSQDSYKGMMNLLANDPLLKNTAIREMVLLASLWDFHSSPHFDKENVMQLIKYIATSSPIPEHRRIASNMIALL